MSAGPIDKLPTANKVDKFVQVAEYFLEDDDAISAEMYHSKAAMQIHLVEDWPL